MKEHSRECSRGGDVQVQNWLTLVRTLPHILSCSGTSLKVARGIFESSVVDTLLPWCRTRDGSRGTEGGEHLRE